MLLLLFACNPWSPVHERELTWYDPHRIETELGVDLVDLPAGEPLPPAPRVVIRRDRIEFDNRGWFLDLPDAFFLGEHLDMEQRRAFLQETTTVVELDRGVVPESVRKGLLIEPLHDTLQQQIETDKELARQLGTNISGDFHLVSEPDVPWETVMAAMYTGGQAQFRLPTLVGRVGDRLGSAMAFSADIGTPGCGLRGTQVITAEGSWIKLPELPALTGPGGCSGMDWTGLHESIGTLLDHCEPRWKREVEGEPTEPESEPEQQSGDGSLSNEVSPESSLSRILADVAFEEHDWNCMELDFLVTSQVTFEEAATAMAAAYERYPRIRQALVYGGTYEAPTCRFPVETSTLSTAQLDHICRSAQVGARLDYDDPRSGYGERITGTDTLPPGLQEHFPEYAAWLVDSGTVDLGPARPGQVRAQGAITGSSLLESLGTDVDRSAPGGLGFGPLDTLQTDEPGTNEAPTENSP